MNMQTAKIAKPTANRVNISFPIKSSQALLISSTHKAMPVKSKNNNPIFNGKGIGPRYP